MQDSTGIIHKDGQKNKAKWYDKLQKDTIDKIWLISMWQT